MIYIVGIGPNEENNIKENIKKFLLENKNMKIIVRTNEHPAVKFLLENNIKYETCDKFYEKNDDFLTTYTEISDYIIENNKSNNVAYLVPGHPMVAELTTKLILEKENDVKILGGESFLDSCFNLAKFDPVEGFSLLDATNLDTLKTVNPKHHTLITQCYDDLTAGEIMLELGEYYPENHKITVLENVGCYNEKKYDTTLLDLQFSVGEEVNNLRTIYIPPYKNSINYNLKQLVPEFKEEITNEKLIGTIKNSLDVIKNSKKDTEVEQQLSIILTNTLDFVNSNDGYYTLENILKNINR